MSFKIYPTIGVSGMTNYGIDIIEVKVIKDYSLSLKFEDGKTGQVDIAQLIPFHGIFEPLKDKQYFNSVYINPEIGTICWENGADLSPAFLYEKISQARHQGQILNP